LSERLSKRRLFGADGRAAALQSVFTFFYPNSRAGYGTVLICSTLTDYVKRFTLPCVELDALEDIGGQEGKNMNKYWIAPL